MTTLRIVCDCGAVIRALPENLIRGRFVQCGLCQAWLRLRVDSGHHSPQVAVGGGTDSGRPAATPRDELWDYLEEAERKRTYHRAGAWDVHPELIERTPVPFVLPALLPVPASGLPCGGSHLTDYTPTWERGLLTREQKRTLDAMIRMRRESAA